ncbi:MAG TPA: hypothetical protein VFI46_02770 [Jiangellaceae bacterium]|nr:hypothetical protein [Jiangellaceae bacterium]
MLILMAPAVAFLTVRMVDRDDAGDGNGRSPASTQAGLCATLGAATDEDLAGARTIFPDRSHDGLHQLAAHATEVDPTAAAELLRTKQRVEALLDGTPQPAELTTALRHLADATAQAAEAVGETDVKGCG